MAAHVDNEYLESLTNEKIYFIAGPEFGPFGLEGHTLVLFKALYGLKSSGQEWHKALSTTLKAEGFKPSLADPDVWMRKIYNTNFGNTSAYMWMTWLWA